MRINNSNHINDENATQLEKDHLKQDRESEFIKLVEAYQPGLIDLNICIHNFRKMQVSEEVATEIFNKIDTNRSGSIDLEEIKQYFKNQDRKLRKLFDSIDRDKSGKINKIELKIALANIRVDNQANIDKMIKIYDKNNDDLIDYNEWKDILIFIPDVSLNYAVNWSLQTTANLSFIIDSVPMQLMSESRKSGESSFRHFFKSFLFGGLSAAIARTFTAPLDRLRLLNQIRTGRRSSMLNGLRHIIHRDGFRGLFRGNFVNILKASPDASIKLVLIEIISNLIKCGNEQDIDMSAHKIFFVGSLSGVIANFCVYPMDVIKTRLACAKPGMYMGIRDTTLKLYKQEGGFKAFYNGYSAALMNTLPNAGLSMLIDNFVLKAFFKFTNSKDVSISLIMTIGAASAATATAILYPFNFLSSNLIMRNKDNMKIGIKQLIIDVYHADGISGYYRGFAPSAIKTIIGSTISSGAYDFLRRLNL